MRRLALALLALSACLPAETDYTASVYGESFIEDGIPADEFIDGWAVTFDNFLVNVGEVTIGDAPLSDAPQGHQIFDLAKSSEGAGFPVGQGALAVSSPVVGYVIGPDAAAVAANADQGLVDLMTQGGWSIYVVGTATRGDQVRPFAWAFSTRTEYTACDIGDAVDAQLTIHGDHLFYDDLVSDSPNLAFDLIAGAGDGSAPISEAELRAVDITTEERYQVGSLTAITNLWQFIEQQTTTLGHINGEGHCDTVRLK